MKVDKKKQTISEDRSLPGLLECEFEYEIKSAKGDLRWIGPKIPPEVWHEVTAFFKWCYDTYHSECQVRLYVSPTQNTWKAWAYPQEAKTGMTARELDNEEKRRQHEELQLIPPDWFAMGTVHHHCSAGAFQSGTDQMDEQDVDGLHITIGKLNDPMYDMHARFYRKGLKVDPDMSWFFEVGNPLSEIPAWAHGFMPKDLLDKTARRLMCTPVVVDIPQQWKDNIIEIKVEAPKIQSIHPSSVTSVPSFYSADMLPSWQRANNAWREIIYKVIIDPQRHEASDIWDAMLDLTSDCLPYHIIVNACLHHKIDLDDLQKQQAQTVDLLQRDLDAKAMQLLEQERRDKAPSLTEATENMEDAAWANLHNFP